jgi:hypothetical protein
MTSELAEKPMSYEEIIDTLKGLVFGTFDRTTSKEREALSRAIDLLSNTDGDCISHEWVLEHQRIVVDDDGIMLSIVDVSIVKKAPSFQPKSIGISREKVCDYLIEFVNHEYATDREREMVTNMIDGIKYL